MFFLVLFLFKLFDGLVLAVKFGFFNLFFFFFFLPNTTSQNLSFGREENSTGYFIGRCRNIIFLLYWLVLRPNLLLVLLCFLFLV